MQVITWLENGERQVVTPAQNVVDLDVEAARVVPEGVAFEIVDDSSIPAQEPTNQEVSTERERRIALGLNATVTGLGSFKVDTRNEEDFRNINGLVSKGIVMQMSGDTTTTVTFRDADNIDRVMNGAQLIEMGASVGNEVDKLYKKSWALKALDPIPQDYTDDSYWT